MIRNELSYIIRGSKKVVVVLICVFVLTCDTGIPQIKFAER